MKIKGIKIDEDVAKILNEQDEQDNNFPPGSFAEWYGEDLTGQTYEGGLNCSHKRLTSLFGCPSKVTGYFWCSENQLTSLEGAPKEIGSVFDCSKNQLTSLKGAPKEVKWGFYCSNNQLITLEGAPKEVAWDFDCSKNQLTSLEGAPEKVGLAFNCSKNQLISLQGAPKEVGGSFNCSYNELTSLKGITKGLGSLDCSNNQLTTLKDAPKEVGWGFDCSNNQLTSLQGAPEKVGRDFDCSSNPNLKSLDGIGKVKGEIISDLKSKKKSSSQSNLSTLDEIKDYMEENDLEEYDLTYDGIKFTFYLEDDDLDYSFESDFVEGSKDELSYKVNSLDDLSDIVPEISEYEVSYTLDYGSIEDKVKIIVDRSDIVESILKESEDFDKVAELLTELNDYYDPDRNNGEFDPYENYNTVEDVVIGLIDLANTID